MKTIGILIIIVAILALAAVWGMTAWNRINFKFSFRGIDLSTIDLASLTASGQTSGKLLLGVTIKNDNPFAISFDKMKVWLYYDNTIIAESSGNLYAQSFNLKANGGTVDVTDYVNVHINTATAKLIKDTVSKQNPKVNYTVKINVWGISLTYSDYFIASI